MKTPDIISKIPKLPVAQLKPAEIQIILRLITILAATHLANKVDKVIKELDKLENPDDIIRIFK